MISLHRRGLLAGADVDGSIPGRGTPPMRELSPKAVYAAVTDRKA